MSRATNSGVAHSAASGFTYDRAGNFLTRKKPGDPNLYWHTYHPGANRLKKIGTGTPDTTTQFTWDASGTLRGEPGITYINDAHRRPIQIRIPKTGFTNFVNFVYDADGRRVKKVYDRGFFCECGPIEAAPGDGLPEAAGVGERPGVTVEFAAEESQPIPEAETPSTAAPFAAGPGPGEDCVCRAVTNIHYLYTHDGRLLREYVNGVGQRDFIHAGDKKVAVYEHGGSYLGKLHFFLTDHLGSTRVLIDSTGAVKGWFDYHPYGTLRASQTTPVNTRHRYTGQEHDTDDILDQHYFGARYLHGKSLRFTAVDPQADRYPGWSPYVYALGDPMRLVDPEGEAAVPPITLEQYQARREQWTGWLPNWIQDILVPEEPTFIEPVPMASAAGRIGGRAIQSAAKTAEPAVDAATRQVISKARAFLQETASKAEAMVKGKGPVAGTAKHEILKQEVRSTGRAHQLSAEVSYQHGRRVEYGTRGSVRVDAVLGPLDNPIIAFDMKTGRATLTSARMRQLAKHLPERTPIEEFRP